MAVDHFDHRLDVCPATIGVRVHDILQDQPVDSGDDQTGEPSYLDGTPFACSGGRLLNPFGNRIDVALVINR